MAAVSANPSWTFRGIDCEFLEISPLALNIICLICISVMDEPFLVECCGNHFCKGCIERVISHELACPTCRQRNFQYILDLRLKRLIYSLKVQCSHQKDGCVWTGELMDLERHLNRDAEEWSIGCPFAKLYCPYKCGQQLQRKEILIHQFLHCPERHRYKPKVQFYDQLSFIQPIDVFQITSTSGYYIYYHCDSLGLSIEAPEGIIPRGSVLPLKVGMCLYGPFMFPKDCTPIAPILMIRPPEDVCLLKPLKITIPIIITEAKDGDVKALGIQVVKTDHALDDGTLIFEELDESCTNLKLHSRNGFGYATFSISHFCFISVRANNSSEVVKRSGYCICPLHPRPSTMSSGVFTYHLCVTYFMEPCITVSQYKFATI